MRSSPLIVAALLMVPTAASAIPTSPELGMEEGRCRSGEKGPAFIVTVPALKDRKGRLKLEIYPANATDFLADDNVLIGAGKVFRRVEEAVPAAGPVHLCIRVPEAGTYAVVLLHDRNLDHKFNWTIDGIGFSDNPKLGWGKPAAQAVAIAAGAGLTSIAIVLNYRSGFGVAPLKTMR